MHQQQSPLIHYESGGFCILADTSKGGLSFYARLSVLLLVEPAGEQEFDALPQAGLLRHQLNSSFGRPLLRLSFPGKGKARWA